MLATLFAAGYVIASGRLSKRIAPLPLAALQQSVGLLLVALLLAGALALGLESYDPAAVPASVWLLVFVSGIVQYALAFGLYLFGLRVLPVSTAGLFLALTPVFGAGGAVLFLGERFSGPQLFGCALVIGAICAVTLRATLPSAGGREGPAQPRESRERPPSAEAKCHTVRSDNRSPCPNGLPR